MQLMPLPQRKLQCGRFELDLSQPQIMGILNVTPDSFSDGGLHHQKEHAIQHALQM
ncbi:MAG: dihydropteroate synthase, partial [Acinetobacter sp.]